MIDASRSPRPVIEASAHDVPVLYTNHITIDGSPHDVRLRLGLMQGHGPGQVRDLAVRELAHVYLSHSHAVALFDALKPLIAQLRPEGAK